MQIQQRGYHRVRCGIPAQGRIDGPVAIAPTLPGMDDDAIHQVDHGDDLHWVFA
jgi:hypothetical protein